MSVAALTIVMIDFKSRFTFHSGASAIGLMLSVAFFLLSGELLLRFEVDRPLGCWAGIECKTTGGCLVASHEMPAVFSAGTLMLSQSSNRSRSSRSSSEM